jgi:hypothetical protein
VGRQKGGGIGKNEKKRMGRKRDEGKGRERDRAGAPLSQNSGDATVSLR